MELEKLISSGLAITLIGTFIKYIYDIKKERLIDSNKKLFEISSDLVQQKILYHECYSYCIHNDFEKYHEYRKSFLKLYHETYHKVYFYYYELSSSYLSTLEYVIDQLNDMEDIYKSRLSKDKLEVKRDRVNELIYEDQYLIDIDKHYKSLHELIKYKKDFNPKNINFKSIDEKKVQRYAER